MSTDKECGGDARSMSKQMTVAELIEKLRALPPDAPVLADGCDCWGEAQDVRLVDYEGKKWALVAREGA